MKKPRLKLFQVKGRRVWANEDHMGVLASSADGLDPYLILDGILFHLTEDQYKELVTKYASDD